MTPKQRAERAVQAMLAKDAASTWFGMVLTEVDQGRAEMLLKVEPHHANGHGTVHGGVIFALADSAFASACNSHNQSSVAQHNMISFVAPAEVGDTLTATAVEVTRSGRSGIYDVQVRNQDGKRIAEMRGFSRTIPGRLFEEEET